MRVALTLCATLGVILFGFSESLTCVQSNCEDENCKKNSTECVHGECNPDGSCKCHPCFKGKMCSDYNDENFPYFLKKEETIYLEPHHKGLVYEASARDEDNYKTCNPDHPCPCGEIVYDIVTTNQGSDFFSIDTNTGDLVLKETAKIVAGDYYKIEIATSNFKEDFPYDQPTMSIDVLTLHIRVRESNSIEDYLLQSEIQDIKKEKKKYSKEVNDKAINKEKQKTNEELRTSGIRSAVANNPLDVDISAKSLDRKKRAAFGTDKGSTNLTLEVTNTGNFQDPLKPGNTIDFKVTIILPEATTANGGLDLLVEIFVMDAVSGITTFALCDPKVTSIGGNIFESDGTTALTVDGINADRITMMTSPEFNDFYERAVIDFLTIVNTDTYDSAATDFAASTIEITFSAIMISNPLFTNDSAILTVGAEFDIANNVWVSQALSDFDSAVISYQSDIILYGPDTMKQFSGGTYDLIAYLSDPYATVVVEIFTPPGISHDIFSIERLAIESKGDNFACVVGEDSYKFYKSVTGRTNHKASITFPILVKNINHDDLAGEAADIGNKIVLSFNIYMFGGEEAEIVTVGAGISIGTTKIWSALINVTVEAGVTPPPNGAISSLTAVAVDSSSGSNPEVNQFMSATWDVHAVLDSPTVGATTTAKIDCTATPGADANICGVLYGKTGKYIAVYPDLISLVEYSGGSASWSLITNTTAISSDQTREAGLDFVSFEVTVMYLTATPADATVTCSGNTVTLSAVAGTAGLDDMSGTTTLLAADNIFYKGSTAGILTTITFPEGGFGYEKMIFESAGDFAITAWGAKVCHVDILKIGSGIGCAAKVAKPETIITKTTLKKATDTSVLDDGASVDFGAMCGSKRDDSYTMQGDQDLLIRVFYNIPKDQTVGADQYNLSIGILLDTEKIWTGWMDLTGDAGVPTGVLAEDPLVTYVTPILSAEIFAPTFTKLHIKMYPGTIRNHIITATSSDPAVLQICRIVIFNLGRNYACIDTSPYGKATDTLQTVIVTHDVDNWAASVTLNLGLIRNFGTGTIDPSILADEDTIEILIIYKGVVEGTADLNIDYNNGRIDTTQEVVSPTFVADVIKSTNTLSMSVDGLDGTMMFYEDVMKQVVITLDVPRDPAYDRAVFLKVINTNPDVVTVCYVAVVSAGINVPCIIPSLIESDDDIGPNGEPAIKLLLESICFVSLSNDDAESKIQIQAGVMIKTGTTSATFDVQVFEDVDQTPVTFTINDGGAYVPENMTIDDVKLSILQNETTTLVVPGKTFNLGLYIEIPCFVTIPMNLGVMTSGIEGHAYATVHGFTWGPAQGKNIQCPEELSMYEAEFLQNATTDGVPMFHESQTDTMTVYLKYLTNTGVTCLHNTHKHEDDLALLEINLLIADHYTMIEGANFSVSFALKIDTTIIVLEKMLYIDRSDSANYKMILENEIFFTDPNFDPDVAINSGEKLELTARLRHVHNESQIEAYEALVRIMLPEYMAFANTSDPGQTLVTGITSDTWIVNVTADLTYPSYLQFDIDFLFFTDIIELNFTVTVDPFGTMPKGLGLLQSSALLRLVCKKGSAANTVEYCGPTTYVNYLVDGTECYDNLNIAAFEDCQFLASSAIDTASDAAYARVAGGWSPPVRDITTWEHFINVDFLRKARVTKIVFAAVTNTDASGVNEYKILSSNDGVVFMKTCDQTLTASTQVLPAECRFESRYARIVLISASDADKTKRIGVSFSWYGCYVDTPVPVNTCTYTAGATPITTEIDKWRHAAYDPEHSIFYFCDWNPTKKAVVCFSTADGSTWNILPSYIGSLKGFSSANKLMYANDSKKNALVASSDGKNWYLVDSTTEASLAVIAALPIPGHDKASFSDVTIGEVYTATFEGITKGGVTVVQWDNCCS